MQQILPLKSNQLLFRFKSYDASTHLIPNSGIISNFGCIILGCLCGEVAVGSKDELIGSEEDEDDDGVDDDDAVDEPKHGSGSSPGESRILDGNSTDLKERSAKNCTKMG